MDPMLEKIPGYPGSSIAVKREQVPYMNYPWHYHPEYELIFVERSYGIRLMGDHIGQFSDGDLVFISANVPHVWRNDQDFYQGNPEKMVDVYVIHFLPEMFERLLGLPEAAKIRELFTKGEQGLSIIGETHANISQQVKTLYHSTGFQRLILLFDILQTLSLSQDLVPLSSPGFHHSNNPIDSQRISVVYEYVMNHFDQPISLEQAASMIHLNKTSFCRYFKSRTSKTFSSFVNEVRIGKACRLLVHSQHTVSQIAAMVGYNNISHFNRQFKLLTGMSATRYKRQFQTYSLLTPLTS